MDDKREWEHGRVLDRFLVSKEETAQALMKGLRAVGYDVDLTPGPITRPYRSLITIYRKERESE